MIRIVFAPDFVEEAVLLAEGALSADDRRRFRRERNPLYEIGDADRRDEAFAKLHARWFDRFGVRRAIDTVVNEMLAAVESVEEARVLRALTRREEGADLVDRVVAGGSGQKPVIVIRLRPMTALNDGATLALLRRELMHVGDMLDPAFGYARSLPAPDGPLTETALRDRYRVLWDTTIDGRLARKGRLAEGSARARWDEFAATFPMLEGQMRTAFDAWFDRDRPTHAEIVAFARTPTLHLSEDFHADHCVAAKLDDVR